MEFNNFFFLMMVFVAFQLFFSQLKKLNIEKANSCFNTFKSNNFLGLLIFLSLVLGKI